MIEDICIWGVCISPAATLWIIAGFWSLWGAMVGIAGVLALQKYLANNRNAEGQS